MSYRLMSLALLLVSAGPSVADNMKMPMNANDLKWGPAPAVLPRGAEATIISGDPSKNEPYVLRVRMPAGYKVPAHHHPTTESVTVLSGNFHLGMRHKTRKEPFRTMLFSIPVLQILAGVFLAR